jgi:transposase
VARQLPFRGFQAGEILLPVAALMNQKAEEALSEPSDRWSVALTETLRRALDAILYLLKAGCQWARPACSLVGAPTAGEPLPCISPNIHGIQKSRGAQRIKQDESART